MFACLKSEHCINTLLKSSLKIQVWNILQCCIVALKELKNIKFNVKYLHKGHKINISFVIMILQYLNVGHKICMLNEKNDDNKSRKLKEKPNCDQY
jgi:hypothetical protein